MTNRRTRTAARIALILSFLLAPAGALRAQNENETVGFQSNHVFESGQFGENIDVLNGGLNLSIPIGPRYQVSRYLAYQLQLSYNSKIWDHTPYPGLADKLFRRSSLGLGFNMHFGRIYKDVELVGDGITSCVWYYVSPDGNEHVLPPDETEDPCLSLPVNGFAVDRSYYQVEGFGRCQAPAQCFETWDGRPSPTNPAPVLRMYTPDGRLVYEFGHMIQVFTTDNAPLNKATNTVTGPSESDTNYNRDFGGWYVTTIYDYTSRDTGHPYGRNYVSIEYDRQGVDETASDTIETSHAIKWIRDNLGRAIEFHNECAPADAPATGCQQIPIAHNDPERVSVRTMWISVPAFKNTTSTESPTTTKVTYSFAYEWKAINHADDTQECPGSPQNCPQTSVNLLTEIDYPQFQNHSGTQTGYRMTFEYGVNTLNPSYPVRYGEIIARVLPTGAKIAYDWGEYYYLSGDTRQLTRKLLYLVPGGAIDGEWTYTREAVLTGTAYTNPKYVTVKDPLGNDTVYHYQASLQNPTPPVGTQPVDYDDGYSPEWDDGVNVRIEYYEGNGASRRLIRSEDHEYDADHSTRNTAKRKKENVRETRAVTTHNNDAGRQATVEHRDWNGRGLWRETIESGDGIGGTRKTRTQYRSAGDPGLFDYREISDGFNVLARTDNAYESSNNLVLTIGRAALPSAIGTGVSLQTNAGDEVTTYGYDSDSNVIQKETGNNGASQDGDGNWHATSAQYKVSYGYQPGGYLVTKRFFDFKEAPQTPDWFPWFAIERERDGNTGLIFKTKDSAGNETTYGYDALGRVKDITPFDANEFPTEVEYVSANKTAVRQGSGATYDCDVQGATGDFLLTCYAYDALGRLAKTQKRPYDPTKKAPFQSTSYDVLGRTTFQSEWLWPDENPCTPTPVDQCGTTFDYGDPATFGQQGFRTADPFGRARTVKTADGQIAQTVYFGQSSMVTVKGVATLSVDGTPGTFDATTRYTRDIWGRLEEVLPPAGGGAKAVYTYDLRDNLTGVDLIDPVTLAAQTRSFEYDALNRLRISVNPESGSEVIVGYDALGNVTAKTDSSGNHTLMTYDGASRLTKVDWQAYQEPGAGLPLIIPVQRNTYDGNQSEFGSSGGRLTSAEGYDDLGSLVHTRRLHYQGLNGRLSRERNLFRGWNSTSGDILDASIVYAYNPFGLVSSTVYPEGSPGQCGAFSTENVYSNGFLTQTCSFQVGIPGGPSCSDNLVCVPLATATYNAAGGIQVITTRGNVSTITAPDRRSRPSQITIGAGTYDPSTDSYTGCADPECTYYRSGSYGYDGAGNIYQMGSDLYGYDGTSRLVQAKDIDDSGTIREQTYLYDAFGNMTEKTLRLNGADPPSAADVYSMTDQTGQTSNRIQQHTSTGTTYAVNYDARGNIGLADGRVHEFDSRNRLISVRALGAGDKELARYAYDGSSNRVRKDDRGRDLWTFYVRDLQGRLLSEFRMTQRGGYTPEWAKHYLYLGSRLIGLRDNMIPSPPAGLGATVSVSGTTAYVNLSWKANPSGEGVTPSKYKVYRSTNVTPPSWGAPATVFTTSYTNTVSKGSTWKYSVTAVYTDPSGTDRESYGTDTLVVKASLLGLLPSAPTSLAADPGDKRVFLTWTANPNASAENVIGYHVYRRIGSGSSVRLTQNPVVQTSFLDQGYSDGQPLVNGTSYTYSVRALSSANLESTSNPEVTTTPNDFTPPGPPLGLRAIPACDGTNHVMLSWKLNVAGDWASYRLLRTEGFSSGDSLPMGVTSSYVDTDTADNTEYTYWVEAIDANQNVSEESLHVTVKTRAPGAVAAPARPFAQSGDGKVSLRVPVASGDPASMRLYRKRNADVACENYELIRTQTRGASYTDFTDGTVSNNVAYDYVLTYVSASGESGFSKAATAFPVQAPATYRDCTENLGTSWSNWKDGAQKCGGEEANPLRRLAVRWEPPSAPNYQPFSANNADGTLGYLLGYRIYRYATPDPFPLDYDAATLMPLQVDYQKNFCQNHPDIPCYSSASCPAGDTCTYHPEDGRCDTDLDCLSCTHCTADWHCPSLVSWGGTAGRCLGRSVGTCRKVPEIICNENSQCGLWATCVQNYCTHDVACFMDSDCGSGEKCVMNAAVDPYLTTYQDSGVNTFVQWPTSPYYAGSCLTAAAVYRIFADGAWRLVESGHADNFDPSRTDPLTRCVATTPDLCYVGDNPQFACAPNGTLPPTPGTPTVSSPAPGKIQVQWEAPGACQPSPAPPCNSTTCPTGQYCELSAPDGVSGFCKFNDPVFCSDSVACQGTGVACESRENEVAGYYIYAGEKGPYHFKPGSPVAWTDSATRSHTFEGLARYGGGSVLKEFSFRVASFDRSGRISNLTVPSSLIAAQEPGLPPPPAAPGSVKTVVWAGAGPTQSSNVIRVMWLPGANYNLADLTGYRVWRSTSESGPFCALIRQTDQATGQLSWVCRDASSITSTDVTASNGVFPPKTSFIDDGVAQDVTYYYAVTAVTSSAESAFSAVVLGLVRPRPAQPLSPPVSFKAEAPNGVKINDVRQWSGIHLKWCANPAREGVTGYNVYRSQNSMGPYTTSNLIAPIPPVCLDGQHRCEIGAGGQVTQSTSCREGVSGNCVVVDTTVTPATKNNPQVYYYVVTAVRDLGGGAVEESGFSNENQGRPNCSNCYGSTWHVVFDPDNSPEVICGDESAAVQHKGESIAEAGLGGDDGFPAGNDEPPSLIGTQAPYRIVGQTSGGPTMPAAAPRFSFFHLNHLGTPVVVTNESGGRISKHHYMPFGEEMPAVAQDTTNKRQFTGHERDDETGTDYMLARYYSSSIGRFMAVDPSSQSIGLASPQSWNRYSYVLNNPLLFVDPRGLKPGIDRGRGVPGSQNAVQAAGLNGGGRIGSSHRSRAVSFQDVDTPGASDNGSTVAGGGAFASYAGDGGSSTDGGYVKVVGGSSTETVNNELANLQLLGATPWWARPMRFPPPRLPVSTLPVQDLPFGGPVPPGAPGPANPPFEFPPELSAGSHYMEAFYRGLEIFGRGVAEGAGTVAIGVGAVLTDVLMPVLVLPGSYSYGYPDPMCTPTCPPL